MLRFACSCIALAGCDLVFSLSEPPGGEFEACGNLDPDPLRYQPLATPDGLTWLEYSRACSPFGMSLAVFDTQEEFQMARTAIEPPYWIGVMGDGAGAFTAIDGCQPVLAFGAGEPAEPNGCVGVGDNFQMFATDCDDIAISGDGIGALCETPRPTKECAARPDGPYTVESMLPVTHAKARVACTDVVEINSSAEIAAVEEVAVMAGLSEFWLAPEYVDSAWRSLPFNCPSVFPWASGEPNLRFPDNCAVYVVSRGVEIRKCTEIAPVICEH